MCTPIDLNCHCNFLRVAQLTQARAGFCPNSTQDSRKSVSGAAVARWSVLDRPLERVLPGRALSVTTEGQSLGFLVLGDLQFMCKRWADML